MAIDITSLVDVVFLLLIFLLVTTTFKRQEHAFPIELPTSGTEHITVTTDKTTVFIARDGSLRLLSMAGEGPGGEETTSVQEVERSALEALLVALHAKHPDAPIAIRAEKDTRYQLMIDVVGLIEKVGFHNVWLPYELERSP